MRRFGGERIKSIMEFAGLEDDVPLENRMISRSIESAQVKVEGYHFDIRKHLVEYDDVVNTHRDIIYGEREKILSGSDLKANIQSMVENELRDTTGQYLGDVAPDQWDTESMLKELNAILPLPPDLTDPEEVAQMAQEEIEDRLTTHALEVYEAHEEAMTPENMRTVERQLMLRSIDINWVQHLTAMENLRQGIGLYAYGQRDPLVMYKKQGHEMFQNLQARIQHDIVHTIYHVGVQPASGTAVGKRGRSKLDGKSESPMSRVTTDRNREPVPAGKRKVGRNEPCPCGSGKKYKKCHGA
jgi:preprotein translocase subunit SecA